MNTGTNFEIQRSRMVATHLAIRGITDLRVLAAMRAVPRHQFVPQSQQHLAYHDQALPIGEKQTISQPYIVALMTQMLKLTGKETVLEIGTGSGYQTAVLCQLARQVYSLEYHPRLAGRAARLLGKLGYNNVDIHVGDGSQGLPDMAPFDAIIVTAAAPSLPLPLRTQLSTNHGRLVIPVGSRRVQHLQRSTRYADTWHHESLHRVRFVPLLGRHGFDSMTYRPDNDQAAV